MLSKYIFILISLLSGFCVQAQDPQFSQYYSAPLYLNPAFAGSTGCTRFVSNYRNQWFGLQKPYNTFAFSADKNLDLINSGVGIQFLSDQIGKNGISTVDISLFYAYRVNLSKKYSLRAGLQAGWGSKSLDILQYTFPDQYSDDGFESISSADYQNKRTRTNYLDISSGILFYSTHFWFGFTGKHINEPNQTFFSTDNQARLPANLSIHSGYKFILSSEESVKYDKRSHRSKSLSPTFLFKHQGPFNQLDIGVYYMTSPVFIGLWYRGIPLVKTVDSFTNKDAIIVQAGIRFERLNFGYSFDYTISQLSPFARGSHELSLGYVFCSGKKKGKERLKTLPCPDFYDEKLFN